ncbi:MAG: septum formation inhibitor Maf [Bacteroidetes bacterium]|nr:septum formation inhibitor Maf [Bacteroidota bacterium]
MYFHYFSKLLWATAFLFVLSSCQSTAEKKETPTQASETEKPMGYLNTERVKHSDAFKAYWYAGKAELASYELEQARYGEIRNGHAVLIFVTEDFLPEVQVKADRYQKTNIPVLKLNFTKKFNTGIYPYSIMTSTFFPVNNKNHAIKVSFSSQEWCGHVYAQLNNREKFDVRSHSYFETEADQEFSLEKTYLEDEIWTQLRLDPASLPTGNISMIPSFEYVRLRHQPLVAGEATATLTENADASSTYSISYPKAERSLSIHFQTEFPHQILAWEESGKSGFGPDAKVMVTKAKLKKTLITDYWAQHDNDDLPLRAALGLE